MTLTLAKLAFAGMRSRLLASALTIVVASAATATTVLALELGGTARDPWQRTFAAAHGAHVLVTAGSAAELRRIAGLPGVAERDAPLPRAIATVASRTDQLEVVGVGSPARIDRPIGAPAPRAGEIVLERRFAEALGLRAGAPITLAGGVRLRVAGTAVTASQPRFPRRNPGLVWATRATLERIAPDRSRWRWRVALRLRDPAAAPTFAARATAQAAPGTLFIETWRDQRASAMRDAGASGVILTAYTLVLLVVVFAVVAILVEARVAAQQREIGLLKAVGITPRQVTAVFAIEAATLGLVAALMGFAAGVVLAPSLATTSSGALLGSPTVAPSLWHLVAGAGPVVAVLVASAWSATRRATRIGVVDAVQRASATPSGHALLALPVPLALGLKDLLARRRRARRIAGAIAVTGAAIVFALSMEATLAARPAGEASDIPDGLPALVYTLDAVLLLITVATLVAVALLSVREQVRDFGVLKAVGLTPRQLTWSLVGAHAAVASLAALLAVPAGLALYAGVYAVAGGSGDDLVLAPWWSLVLVPIATVLLVAGAMSPPARIATRMPAADALRYE